MHLMADALMKYETIDSDQIDQIMEGKVLMPLTAGQMMIVVHQAKTLMLHQRQPFSITSIIRHKI